MTGIVTIRAMRVGDVDVCARMMSTDPLWQRYGITLASARRVFRRALGQAARVPRGAGAAAEIAVALRAGHVVGFIWFLRGGTFHHSGYIRSVAVDKTARGHGIGARLLAHAERRILRRGPNVFLLVSHFNRRAQAFYRRNGYSKVGEVPDYVVPGITEYVFRKTRGPLAAPRA